MVVGFCFCLLFLFVPETFWDRTPRPRKQHHNRSPSPARHRPFRLPSFGRFHRHKTSTPGESTIDTHDPTGAIPSPIGSIAQRRAHKNAHVGFAPESTSGKREDTQGSSRSRDGGSEEPSLNAISACKSPNPHHSEAWKVEPQGDAPKTPNLHNLNSPYYSEKVEEQDYFSLSTAKPTDPQEHAATEVQPRSALKSPKDEYPTRKHVALSPGFPQLEPEPSVMSEDQRSFVYTEYYRSLPPKSFVSTLKPWNGRLTKEKWLHVMIRPFILFAYPSVLWSTLVYSLSIGWLIVLSESVTVVYRNKESYNFTALQTGLVYLSPFIGGVLGTAVAGKVSDLIVRYMSRKNDGIYEPEFRLVMAIPVAVCTTIGLMGFGWSAQERDRWIVPTVFFAVISFGCSLGSTTAITFCVDSYRQYAGEALVTLNFSKSKSPYCPLLLGKEEAHHET